jgi:hypothetical protein
MIQSVVFVKLFIIFVKLKLKDLNQHPNGKDSSYRR